MSQPRKRRRPPTRRRRLSAEDLARRAALVPVIGYPEELPVSARREDLAAAIRDHQVVIVAGETGSERPPGARPPGRALHRRAGRLCAPTPARAVLR